jgi:hypothetical protein
MSAIKVGGVKANHFLLSVALIVIGAAETVQAETTAPERKPNITNKALITKSPPNVNPSEIASASKSTADAVALHKLADEFYIS